MDLNELQSVRDRERQTDKLQQLRESFYADAGGFIEQLRAERDRAVERVDDPFDSSEVRQLSDEINTAEQTVEAIYEKRVGKIVKAASFAAADLPAEVDGMTAEEQELFDQLVGDIKQNRAGVMALLDGDERPSTGGSDTTAPPTADSASTDATPREQSVESATQQTPTEKHTPPQNDVEQTPHPSQETESQPTSGSENPDGSRGAESHEADELRASAVSGEDHVAAADLMGGSDTVGEQEGPGTADPHSTPEPASDPSPQAKQDTEPQVRKDGGATPASETTPTKSEQESGPQQATTQGASTKPKTAEPGTTDSVEQSTGQEAHIEADPATTPEIPETTEQNRASDAGQTTAGSQHSSDNGIERTRVQILDTVETFMGFDERDYDLEPDDVVSLPDTNAEILLERGVAREL